MRLKDTIKDTLYRIVTEYRYRKWLRLHQPQTEKDKNDIRKEIGRFEKKPSVSIIMPVYNTPVAWLKKAVKSVQNQLYPNWELCIADDNSTSRQTLEYLESLKNDERIKIEFRKENGHISEASNSALEMAIGDFVCFLDHDDELSCQALYRVVQAINMNSGVMFLYSDEDKMNERGLRSEPHFKSSWNLELLRSYNYINHLAVFDRARLNELHGLRKGYEGAQDYDLILRYIDTIGEEEIVHIPHTLYHWRKISTSTAQGKGAKPYTAKAGRQALQDHLSRRGIDAHIDDVAELTNTFHVRYSLQQAPLVSIIIPTRDHGQLLQRCLASIFEKTTYPHYEIVIIDNRSTDSETLKYLTELEKNEKIRILRYDNEFNFSAINNFAVAEAQGELVCLLNNDTEIITNGWLATMVSHLEQPLVGAVGVQLLYPDDTLQHAGVILGIGGGAGHSHKYIESTKWGYMARANVAQNLSAVTGACLIVKKRDYLRVGGLDEANFSIAFNDVDFCLKLREAGLKIVYTPHVKLYHFESKSRGLDTAPDKVVRFDREKENLKAKWGSLLKNDPYYNRNLSLSRENFSLSDNPRP